MAEFLLGAGIGFLYVELLFRILKRSLPAVLITYPLRVTLFATALALLLLKSGIIPLIGFISGFLLYTFLRGFVKIGVPKVS